MMLRWYAIQTRPRAEWGLHADLRCEGFRTLYLHYYAKIKHARREIGILKPYFPRYIFAAIEPGQSIGPINEHRLTAEIVSNSDGPIEVPEIVIAELESRGDDNGKIGNLTPDQRKLIEEGSEVRVLCGPFEGFLATVALDEGSQVRVWLQLFKGRIEARFPPRDLEVISPAGPCIASRMPSQIR